MSITAKTTTKIRTIALGTSLLHELVTVLTLVLKDHGIATGVQDTESNPITSLNIYETTLTDGSIVYDVELDNGIRD